MRDVIQRMQVIGIIFVSDATYGRHNPSFATTAASIQPKWRRDSAERDAKQTLSSVAGSSAYRNERNVSQRRYK